MPRYRSAVLRVSELERRDAPATLVSPYKMTYQDADGDAVAVTFSKPILTPTNVNAVFAFGMGSVEGDNTARQPLWAINLTGLGAAATGTSITVTSTRSAVTGGDGYAAVGQIDATGIDLGTVTIDGDLGRVLAGDTNSATPGLRALKTQSLGLFGLGTGAPDLRSQVSGRVGSVSVRSNVRVTTIEVFGDLGPVTVGGSLVGTADGGATIATTGAVGPVVIKGDVDGGGGDGSASIAAGGSLAGVTIGGSLRGGPGTDSGGIFAIGAMGPVVIRGDMVGGGGNMSGTIFGKANISAITLGGSLLAGAGFLSGTIAAGGQIGAIRVGRDVLGIPGSSVPIISALGDINPTATSHVAIASLTVGGRVESALIQAGVDLTGSSGRNADAQIGAVTVGGDWIASSIAAGATQGTDLYFGDGDDTKFSGFGVNDNSQILSKIVSVTIGGQVLGTGTIGDHFGIVAETVGSVTVGGTRLLLSPGPHNDNLAVGITGDFTVHEI
jgi:hypothetical protein